MIDRLYHNLEAHFCCEYEQLKVLKLKYFFVLFGLY